VRRAGRRSRRPQHVGGHHGKSHRAVIYNGVDTERFDKTRYRAERAAFGLPERAFLVCCVARLAPQKRFDVLVDALAELKQRGVHIHCVIAGQDRLGGWLQNTLVERGLEEMVTYLGPSKDVPRLIGVCDAMVLTSDNEGCPNSVLEAMGSGVPVLVTASGAEEFVIDGETGYVVPTGDWMAVADRLAGMAQNREDCERLGRNARDWVLEHASIDSMLIRYFELFAELSRAT